MRLHAAVALLSLAAAVSASAAATDDQHCKALEQQAAQARRGAAPARTASVALAWGAAPARAAAALLRAALIAAGHRAADVTLLRLPASARLCSLLRAATPRADVLVAVAAAWAPEDGCALGGRALRPQGGGAAPAAARLHVRLGPAWRALAACAPARGWQHYGDIAALRSCGFVPPGNETEENATVYVLEGEWERETQALRGALGGARLRLRAVPRAELARLVAHGSASFLFLDAPLWSGEPGVSLAPPPSLAPPDRSVALSVADEYALRTYAPALARALPDFAPRAAELRRVLHGAAPLALEEAACARPPLELLAWSAAAAESPQHRAVVLLCTTELADVDAYKGAIALARDLVYNSTVAIDLAIGTRIAVVDCADRDRLIRRVLDWAFRGELSLAIGVAAPAAAARALAPYAAHLQLPLVTYDAAAAPELRSAAGRPEHVARALRGVLAACGWRRLGVLADESAEAAALAAALRAPGAGLQVREAGALADLVAAQARVILVSGGAAASARALAAALAAGLTPDAGYVWLVAEYGAADNATAALRPLSVSLQWRGAAAREAQARGATLRAQLDAAWRGRAWPRYAASLLDALLTLGEGFKRLVTEQPAMRDHPYHKNKLRDFWNGVKNCSISGVMEPLSYDDGGVTSPRVYLQRWGDAPRPLVLPLGRCPLPRPPPDGAARCLLPTGDPFHPTCHDVAAAAGGAALAAAAAALALAVRAARRRLARRDRRRELRVYTRLLARRQRAFAALAPHLVDRAALELRRELGAGRFGRVHLAVLRAPGRARPAVLAAKALREDAAPAEESQFLREACTLAALRHDHIVRFAGVCVADGPPLLLMEHAFFGDLLRYLRARRHLAEGGGGGGGGEVGREEAAAVSAEALTRLAREAAEALAHLARCGLVHRDVRAANCLVDGRRALKLADFGLARETGAADGEYACRGRALFPVLWMAPESLARGVASAASDVWAFGVLALELVTLGARPFGDAAPPGVVRAVLAGGRAPLPRDAGAETRALLAACWRRDAGARPAAARLAAWLAARRTALAPALAPQCRELDCDSGFGEARPDADALAPDSDASPVSR